MSIYLPQTENVYRARRSSITLAAYQHPSVVAVFPKSPPTASSSSKPFQHYRAAGHYKLHAFVVMPEHVPLLLTPNDQTISKVMNLIKGGFSHRIGSKFPIWQRSFVDHLVQHRADFETRRNYIHQNPVGERLSATAEEYAYSSAAKPAWKKPLPQLWCNSIRTQVRT